MVERGTDVRHPAVAHENAAREAEGSYSVRSLARGLSVLRCFAVEHPEWGITELSRHLGLNKATVFRLVKTLEAEGFLTCSSPGGKYYVGSTLLRIAYVGLSRSELEHVAHPYMEKLVSEFGESVNLAVWTAEGVMIVDQVETTRPLRPLMGIGKVLTDMASAHSKVFVAHMPEEKMAAILAKPLPKSTRLTVTDPERLRQEFERVVAEGAAYDFEEHLDGICSVAAPIFDPATAKPRASLCFVTPASRFGAIEVKRQTGAVKEAAAAISRELGNV